MTCTRNALEIFKNDEFGEIRAIVIDGEIWFAGKDVAKALGYERESKAIVDRIDNDDRVMIDGKTQSQFGIELGQRGGWIINESGLYSLILSSKLPSAKRFRHWITAELTNRKNEPDKPTEETPKTQVLPCSNGSLKVFSNAEFGTIRTVLIDGEPWFVGKDVATALGYKNQHDALGKHVDAEDKGVAKRDSLGGTQDFVIINESGLYSLILSSRLESAKKFKHWITAEVIPSIRKHGVYMTDNLLDAVIANPEVMQGVIEKLKAERRTEQEKLAYMENALRSAVPKAVYYDTFVDPGYAICFRDTAKELGFSQKEFIKLLIDHKFIYRTSTEELRPMAGPYKHGLFILRDYTNIKNRHRGTYTLVTTKGKKYIYEYFVRKGIINN
ncbi:MAG: phage antirepressor KilAC domain-containing protein [Firmicutes bacterium]|nr:phage antirepressor KilAC domain-containing protein [Bacillota bacterium]